MPRPSLPILLSLALAVTSCGRRPDDVPVEVSAIGSSLETGDPSRGPLDMPARVLMDATAQGLVRFDANGQIEAGLAERWIVIDDGRSYIFRLRDMQWADGSAVTAAQVVQVLRRAAAPDSRNALAANLAVIDEIVEMTPQVIEVRLKRPRPDLLKLFAQPELAVFTTRARIGTGPFQIQPSRGGGLLLRPVADPSELPEDITTHVEPARYVRLRGEPAALALARFAAKRSDLVLGGTVLDWPLVAVAGVAATNVKVDPAAGLFGFAIVSREGFLADARNRAAIAMTIDRTALTNAVRQDWAPTETLLPEMLDSAAPPAVPAWQLLTLEQRRANALAQVTGWRRSGQAVPRLRIAMPRGPGAKLIWHEMRRALAAIGLTAEWVAAGADADLRLVDAVAPYDSGRWYLANACQLCSENSRMLIEAARDAATLDARAQRIAEADAALSGEVAFIPIARPLRWSAVALRLQAWKGNSRAWHVLNHLRNDTR